MAKKSPKKPTKAKAAAKAKKSPAKHVPAFRLNHYVRVELSAARV